MKKKIIFHLSILFFLVFSISCIEKTRKNETKKSRLTSKSFSNTKAPPNSRCDVNDKIALKYSKEFSKKTKVDKPVYLTKHKRIFVDQKQKKHMKKIFLQKRRMRKTVNKASHNAHASLHRRHMQNVFLNKLKKMKKTNVSQMKIHKIKERFLK